MRLLSEDFAERINITSRTSSFYRRPRRSIYDQDSPTTDTKPPPPWPPARHSRSTSRVSQHTNCPSALPSGSSDTTVGTLPPERSRTVASADNCRPPRSAYATLGRATPRPGPRATSSMSAISFRSLRSINSRIKVRMQSLGQAVESRKARPEFDWSSLRAEYELHLARGSIIERCLVEVDLGPEVTERGRWWIDTVWTLADRLSPPLPALLAQYSAAGLLPLLYPLRHTLHSLALQLPYDHTQEPDGRTDQFLELTTTLRRALWYAGLVEGVIEMVSRVGLVKFELIGLGPIDEAEADQTTEAEEVAKVAAWRGEIRGRTGSGDHWRGAIKV